MAESTPPEGMAERDLLGPLEEEECWRLLATQSVGRVAVIVGHYPLVFPVNYALDGRSIVFRTGVGTKLHAIHRSNVTFEVDVIDPYHRTGWSVMVTGAAHEVSARNPDFAQLPSPEPWAAGSRDHLVRISVDEISGRTIHQEEFVPLPDHNGFL